jgi:cytochrome c
MTKRLTIVAGCLFLVSTSAGWADGDPQRGERAFAKCSACHSIDKPRTRLGPHLMGVAGRPAGSVADYKYSDGMKEAAANGLVWTDEKLHAFLSSPKSTVPGTSMRFFGLWSDSEIDDLIAYLKTVPAPQ